ncbi:hypothetical protein B0A52_10080 [Exophiala mesophila]|uniref:Fe2OG dioxygenase domain-containing protein n=1 Tax=Exophiala mesophila TaxID=212818 RepID=A0A438MT75_EXOME|nr:hypothetical protein B0A52_10080 [Exophiala mesophila]
MLCTEASSVDFRGQTDDLAVRERESVMGSIGEVVPDKINSLPVIDFSRYTAGSAEERLAVSRELVQAFKSVGFVYLLNHGIPNDMVHEAFDWMSKFFNLPQKELCAPSLLRPKAVPESRSYKLRGYSPVGGEKISQSIDADEVSKLRQVEDVRDMFDFGADIGVPSIREPNMWPSEEVLPGFKDFSMKFFWTCNGAGLDVLRAIALGLDLPENFFADAHSDNDHLIRYHHYPQVDRKSLVEGTKARVGAHSDYGTMTLLFQDKVGGLEVEHPTKKGQFDPAPYLEGAAIVNIGDFLQRWTNDVLKSTLHRVVAPQVDDGTGFTRERRSIPFFMQADRHTTVQCAPGLEGETGVKYPPITAMEHLYQRTANSY